MINIKNTQRKIALDVEQLRQDAQKVLDLLGYSDFDLGIWITNNKTIKEYNKNFRNKNKSTDILSFPYHTELKPGQRIKIKFEEDKNLGDIIISAEYVQKETIKYETTFNNRLKVLLVHGICHLLGYDHIKDEDYDLMHKKEIYLLYEIS